MRCYRRLLNITYKDNVTNKEVRNKIWDANGNHDDLFTIVKKRKLLIASVPEPRYEKTGLRGFRPGPTQTGLYSHRRCLEA